MSEFYLKILSGNHLGAEIPLEPGQYTFGKSDECDLVVTDATLSDVELVITIGEEGSLSVTTNNTEEPLYHNGTPGEASLQLNPFDVITSSGIFLALGPADADWPDLPLPELQRPEPPEEPEEEEEANTESEVGDDEFPDPDADEDDETTEVDLDLDDEEDESEEDDEDEDDEEAFENPLANIDRKWLIGVPVGVLVFFIGLILLISGGSGEEEVKLTHLQQAKELRHQQKLKDVRLKELPDQTILLSGYTTTLKEKQSLQRQLREKGIPFSSQLVVMSELRANADALLKNRGYKSLSLELDNTPGSLVMAGYVGSADELNKIMTMLKQEVHGLVSIVDQVENQAGRLNTLKSMLREKGLSPRIHLIQKPNQITLEGHLLDDEQVYNLNDVVTRFRKRYGNQPALKLATKSVGSPTQPSASAPLAPSLRIRGVSMGRVPYVVMEDGAKYLIGAKLANGYIIEDINLEYLLLSKGTDRVKYRLGGNRGGQSTK